MRFIKSNKYKIELTPEQQAEVGSIEDINNACGKHSIISYDIYDNDNLIGFAQLRKYKRKCFFLWHFGIDISYQNKNLGTRALIELIDYLKNEYNIKEIVTTYTYGNNHAKHVYEKVGFVEINVVDEDGIHEVDMLYKIAEKDK